MDYLLQNKPFLSIGLSQSWLGCISWHHLMLTNFWQSFCVWNKNMLNTTQGDHATFLQCDNLEVILKDCVSSHFQIPWSKVNSEEMSKIRCTDWNKLWQIKCIFCTAILESDLIDFIFRFLLWRRETAVIYFSDCTFIMVCPPE